MKAFYLLLIILTLANCSSQKTNDIEQIKSVLAKQSDAWNKGNLEGFMSGYLQSDSLRFASGGSVTYGWETNLKRYKKGYPDKAVMGKLTFSKIDIKIISDHSALVFGKWELERENDHPWGLFTLLFEKTNNGWLVVHDHTSSANK